MDVTIEPRSDYLYVRISGKYQGIIPAEIAPENLVGICRDSAYNRILADAREFMGRLDTVTRYEMATELMTFFPSGSVRIAVVENPERAERVSFFETVTVNRGGLLKVFTEFDEAVEWLTIGSDHHS